MARTTFPEFVRFLLKPSIYPHDAPEVTLLQTHISYVFLAGAYAYKFKKPVNFGFLNFSTLTQRRFYCDQELELNRRLCPSIYLDVVTVNRKGRALSLNGPGCVVEYGVKMRRLPTDRIMTVVIQQGGLTEKMINDIVAVLIPFYARAARHPMIDSFGTAAAVGANVFENLHQVEPFIGCEALPAATYARIFLFTQSMLAHERLFSARIAEGRIRDCHGDLHSGNICLADQVYIFDCIEFNKRFRYSDVASDIAFLAMDLEYNRCEALAERVVSLFENMSGDVTLREVLPFYKCYRAMVRGKIGLLMSQDPKLTREARKQADHQASRYFSLALQYAQG